VFTWTLHHLSLTHLLHASSLLLLFFRFRLPVLPISGNRFLDHLNQLLVLSSELSPLLDLSSSPPTYVLDVVDSRLPVLRGHHEQLELRVVLPRGLLLQDQVC
jgi:hypothetical protein